MELLILAIILGVLVFLSLRFGYDSRAAAYSKERELARFGMVWGVETQGTHPRRHGPGVRRRLAQRLRALARWLNPELAATYRTGHHAHAA